MYTGGFYLTGIVFLNLYVVMVEYQHFSNGGIIYCTGSGLECNDVELVRVALRREYDSTGTAYKLHILCIASQLGIYL